MKLIIDIPVELAEKGHWYTDEEMWTVIRAAQNGTPLEQIRAEIERLHYHPKLDFIKNDEVVEMALDIIDRHRESEVRNEKG
jgi:hypothetical protein